MKSIWIVPLCLLISACPPKVEKGSATEPSPEEPEKQTPRVEERDPIEGSSDSTVESLTFSKAALPSAAKYKGGVIDGLRFRDKNGENHVVFSRDPLTGESKNREIWLFANHYAVDSSGEVKTLRTVKQKADCDEFDLIADFRTASFGVTDLDSDGLGEVTFAYRYTCTSDVSPLTYKLLMIENGDKYIMRGSTEINAGNGEYYGGDYTIDESFQTAPLF